MDNLIKSKAQFTFELGGPPEIGVESLSDILNNVVLIITELVQNEPDSYINLKVTKFSTGSFDIDFQAIAEQIPSLISSVNVAANVVGGLLGVFGIAKHLKGKNPREVIKNGENSTIVNFDGNSVSFESKTVNQYFEKAKIENSIICIINSVDEHEKRPFRITDGDKEVTLSVEEMKTIEPVVQNLLVESQECLINECEAVLLVRKPDLVGSSKWGFVYDGNIEATIEDKEWLSEFRETQQMVCSKSKMRVILRIETPFDKNQLVIPGNTKYIVVKVLEFIPADKNIQISINT